MVAFFWLIKMYSVPVFMITAFAELINNMLSLKEDKPRFLFKQLFMQELSDYTQASLTNSTCADYYALAREADKLFNEVKKNMFCLLQVPNCGRCEMKSTKSFTQTFSSIANLPRETHICHSQIWQPLGLSPPHLLQKKWKLMPPLQLSFLNAVTTQGYYQIPHIQDFPL